MKKMKSVIENQPTIDPETLPIVQELRSRNKRLKAVVKAQLEQLREKTSVIDELCEKVADLDEKLQRVTKERDAAIADLRERSIESYAECMYCKHIGEKGVCFDCTNGINWEWRGIQEVQENE